MSRTFYDIYQSPAKLFDAAKSVKRISLIAYERALNIFNEVEMSTEHEFYGSWKKTCQTFDECSFKSSASLTDDIINDLRTVDFSELKWKFARQLDEGDAVDVEQYIAGKEKCWTGMRRMPKPRRSVRIYINFGGNCSRTARELAVAGAVGITFAEIMESMGVSAEIWGVLYNYGMDLADNSYVTMVKLKAQNEYSDLGLINFILGDNGVFRNAVFRIWLATAAKNGYDVGMGLGQSRTADQYMLGLTPVEQQSAVIVPQVFSIDKAKEWLLKACTDYLALQPDTDADFAV